MAVMSDPVSNLTPLADYQLDDILVALEEAKKTGALDQITLLLAAAERELISIGWYEWLSNLFTSHCKSSFGGHHERFWDWVWSIKEGEASTPFVAIWPRGGAKSTSAELACVALGARGTRQYALYVCGTQERADDHVGNVSAMLESDGIAKHYPALASRRLGKYGSSKGWRRNRVRTAAGFTIDAIGLDTAARGIKLEQDRPDLIILDDLDDGLDSPASTRKKISSLTRTILPAMAESGTVLAIQNLVHIDSIFAQLADTRAEFLIHREVSGPIPAVQDLETKQRAEGGYIITNGTASWEGQDLDDCQRMIDEFGLSSFLVECQHDVEIRGGGLFDHVEFQRVPRSKVPPLVETTVWVDPAVTDTDQSDSQGIQVDGIAANGFIYRLRSWEQRSSPVLTLRQALIWAFEEGATGVGVETDQGGDTWESVYREALTQVIAERPEYANQKAPRFLSEKAGAGHGPKAHRAAQMLSDYERGRIVHVEGACEQLERGLRRFPKVKPYDLVDASFWSWHYLRRRRMARTSGSVIANARLG
jgi:hypothetical protein